MGFTVSRYTHIFASIFAVSVLGGCSGKPADPVVLADVQSIDIFYTVEDNAGAPVGKVYSFSADAGVAAALSDVNTTADSIAMLNTDEDELGYEFSVFADGLTLKLLNYSKSAPRRLYDLQEFGSQICGVYPVKRPAEGAYTSSSGHYRETIDDTGVYVALGNDDGCSRKTDSYYYIDFDTDARTLIQESRQVTSADVFSALLIDTTYSTTNDDGERITGRTLVVGHDYQNEVLNVKEYGGETLLTSPLTYKANPLPSNAEEVDPPHVLGLRYDQSIIQRNVKTYNEDGSVATDRVELIPLSLDTIKNILEPNDTISAGDALAAYLDNPFESELTLEDDSKPLTHVTLGDYFVFEDDNALYRHKFDDGRADKVYTRDNFVQSLRFSVTTQGNIVLRKRYENYDALSTFPNDGSDSETLVITRSEKIEFTTNGTSIYLNALRPDDIIDPVDTVTWVLAEINNNRIIRQIPGAMFAFIDAPLEADELLILTSTAEPVDEYLIAPYVSKYDSTEVSGILTFREYSENELNLISSTAARFGQITQDVSLTSNEIYGANFKLNKDFGGLQVQTARDTLGYYYKPDQASSEEANRTPSLSLLKTELGENAITLNGVTVTERTPFALSDL